MNADPRSRSRDQRANGKAIKVRLSVDTSFASYAAMKHAVDPSDLPAEEIRKDRRTMRVRGSMRALALASVILAGATGSAIAADKWFVIGQKALNSTETSAEVTAEGGKLFKEDIKKTKISVEGGDVEISKVVLRWNNRPDDTITNVGVVKSGGETAPKDAPGREATLTGVAVQYKVLNGAPTLKVWGFD